MATEIRGAVERKSCPRVKGDKWQLCPTEFFLNARGGAAWNRLTHEALHDTVEE